MRRLYSATNERIRFWAVTSRPIVGSSRNRTCGRCSSAPQISTFIRSPSDRLRTGLLTRSPRSSSSISSSRMRDELGLGQPVDRAEQLERVERGQVPLELVPVAHHHRDPAQELALPLRRRVAEHARLARRRVQQPRQHLERRRLAGAVGPEEADDLAARDLEADAVDRGDLARLAPHQALRRGADPRLAHGHVERLAQLDRPDGDVRGAGGADRRLVGRDPDDPPRAGVRHWLSIWARWRRPL